MIEAGLERLGEYCPICGNTHFLRGPSGGLGFSVNIECTRCGQRYNVATSEGRLIQAQRIDYNGLWPDRGDWQL